MPPPVILDPSSLDLNAIVADQEKIRSYNPQRYEMEHLNRVIFVDKTLHIVAGIKDVRHDEFWVRGHLPDYPLLPGVIMCEAAAQLCSFYASCYSVIDAEFIGFGGMEDVRFRNQVRPGDQLVMIAKALKIHRKAVLFNCQSFVNGSMVFHGEINGVALPKHNSSKVSAKA